MKQRLEYWLVVSVAGILGWLPRPVARVAVRLLTAAAYWVLGRLRKTGQRNLAIAFPEMPPARRKEILWKLFRNLGRQMVEFCRMPCYTAQNTQGWLRTEGLENFLAAQGRGKGVLVLTGHLGAWELSSFYHSLMGHPMGIVIRRLDNTLLDAYVNRIRTLHGNRVLHKDDFARGLLKAMHGGGTVGILMDTNMTPPQGVFANFFGVSACTGSGLARVALKTGAAVLPGFCVWEPEEQQYVLRFGPELHFAQTDDAEADILAATQQCNDVLESWIRRYPDQWLWIHRRWKTRPAGEPPIY
jgi:KDO2-lipid IV(A) lauroyltransferase